MDMFSNIQFGIAPALARALLDSLWQGAILAGTAALAFHMLSRRSAALRHTVGMIFLLAMVVAPAWRFMRFWSQPGEALNAGMLPVMAAPMLDMAPGVFVQQSNALAATLCVFWLLGVALMLLRQLFGWRLIGALDKHPFYRLPPEWQQRIELLQRRLRITRTVLVRLSDDVVAPFTARLLRPVIWLPVSLLTQLPREQVEALLAHELAHIARLDWLWNGLQCVVESLLFFHPGVWWLGRRIRQEREHACDDLAVAACGDAIALAEALTELERIRHPVPRLLLSAQGGSLMKRISRLLMPSPKPVRWWAPVGLAALLASGVVIAAQLNITHEKLPTLRIESSTQGELHAGDYREITARGVDKLRYYRTEIDASGRLVEIYKEDGVVRPIDANARVWIKEFARLANLTPPAPPAPPPPSPESAPLAPSPPSPASLPSPPAVAPSAPAPPPAPPAPPALADSEEFQLILQLVSVDESVRRQIGDPISLKPRPLDGEMSIDGAIGHARLSFELSGPLGQAQVRVSAARANGVWTISTLDVSPSSR